MTPSSHAIVQALIGKQLLSAAEIIDRGIKIRPFERKNISYQVRTPSASLLVKLAKHPGDESIAREAGVYTALERHGQGITDHLPRRVDYDADRRMLVLEWIEGHTLYDYHRLQQPPHPWMGRQLGQILKQLHAIPLEALDAITAQAEKPWVLDLAAPPLHLLSTESSGTLQLIRMIQAEPVLLRTMDAVAGQWRRDAVCHNDFRLNNVLHAAGAEERVCLIDWELCSPGYSLWDLAGFFESYVQLWVLEQSARKPAAAAVSITHFQRLIGACWTAYGADRTPDHLATLTLVAKLIGMKLLQSALEYAQQSNDPTRESVMLIECAKKFCTRPLEAWVHILGIPLARRAGPLRQPHPIGL